ncbi:DUF3606 domain-containing protein [Herbaspirillum sp. GCM10030257]
MNVNEPHEVRYWTEQLGVSEARTACVGIRGRIRCNYRS